jgi:hypothetical protein
MKTMAAKSPPTDKPPRTCDNGPVHSGLLDGPKMRLNVVKWSHRQTAWRFSDCRGQCYENEFGDFSANIGVFLGKNNIVIQF